MEYSLDTLVDKIKTDAIEKGEKTAQEIIAAADQKSETVLAQAASEAQRILADAQKESDNIILRGKNALKQAQRDTILSLKSELEALCKNYVSQVSVKALDHVHLKDMIVAALSNWNLNANDNVFVHISSEDAQHITKEVISGAVQALGSDIEIKVDDTITSGFKISKGDGNYMFDFTSEAISEALSIFLTPNIQELLK